MLDDRAREIVDTVKVMQRTNTKFKRMAIFPWEVERAKTPNGHNERKDVTAFITEVKRIRCQKDNILMWHFKTSKEANKARSTISVRKINFPELKLLEIHKKKNKIYGRWNKNRRNKK